MVSTLGRRANIRANLAPPRARAPRRRACLRRGPFLLSGDDVHAASRRLAISFCGVFTPHCDDVRVCVAAWLQRDQPSRAHTQSGIAHLVERQIHTLKVAGSNPASKTLALRSLGHAVLSSALSLTRARHQSLLTSRRTNPTRNHCSTIPRAPFPDDVHAIVERSE